MKQETYIPSCKFLNIKTLNIPYRSPDCSEVSPVYCISTDIFLDFCERWASLMGAKISRWIQIYFKFSTEQETKKMKYRFGKEKT